MREDDSMTEMVESIMLHGVLVPGLVRPKQDGSYEMVAGHRRKMASRLAGKTDMDCIVRELTDEEAIIIMVDSNLQREQLLPSEKAFAYKMKLDALKRQGKRLDLTSTPVGPKLGNRSNQELAEQSPDSKTQIQRYIRQYQARIAATHFTGRADRQLRICTVLEHEAGNGSCHQSQTLLYSGTDRGLSYRLRPYHVP